MAVPLLDTAPRGWDFAESQLSTSDYVGTTELGSNFKTYRIAVPRPVPRDTVHGFNLTVGEQIGLRVLIDYAKSSRTTACEITRGHDEPKRGGVKPTSGLALEINLEKGRTE